MEMLFILGPLSSSVGQKRVKSPPMPPCRKPPQFVCVSPSLDFCPVVTLKWVMTCQGSPASSNAGMVRVTGVSKLWSPLDWGRISLLNDEIASQAELGLHTYLYGPEEHKLYWCGTMCLET